MVPRRENMLEAFRKASPGASEATPEPKAAPAKAPPKPPRAKPKPRSSESSSWASGARGLSSIALPAGLPGVLAAALLLGIVFSAGVLVGRRSQVSAADPAVRAELEEAARLLERLSPAGLVPAGARGADPRSLEELAQVPAREAREVSGEPREPLSPLMDPANVYTIVVVTYGATQEDLAYAAYDHLEAAGLPVNDPYMVGDKIVVFVGAAPRNADLADLEQRVRALSRGEKARVYADAYRIRIDQYVVR